MIELTPVIDADAKRALVIIGALWWICTIAVVCFVMWIAWW